MFYIVSHHPPDKGGAEMFLQQVQEWLLEEGIESQWVKSIDDISKDVEFVITSGVHQTATALWATRNRVPCIVLIQHWKEVYDPEKRVIRDLFFDLMKSDAILATCSMFLRREIWNVCNVWIPRIVYPVGSYVEGYTWNKGDYLFVPNISQDKGGIIFNDLMDTGIPLVGISHSQSKFESFIKEKAKRLQHVLITPPLEQSQVFELMQNAKAVLCVHNVEETFCKTAWEAMCIGVPVICKENGNFPYLFGDQGHYASGKEDIVQMCKKNLKPIRRQSMFCPFQSKSILMGAIHDAITKPQSRTMYMGPWSDQGLGRQLQRYVKESEDEPVIFSWKCAINRDIVFQGSSLDWVYPYVYWSEKYRHNLTKEEIETVIRCYGVTNLYVLEPSNQIFDSLKGLQCNVIAIPNIETVRKSELSLYRQFDQIICHTRQCYEYFSTYSHSIYHPLSFNSVKEIPPLDDPVKYLFLGGTKLFGRKQANRVVAAFKDFPNQLTMTWQTPQKYTYENVNMITRNLSSDEIDTLYASHDVVIVLSCQEGLGLSIIEALERGKPVITTDVAPHNEYIQHGVNGWLIKGKKVPLMDNPEPLFSGCLFDTRTLVNTLGMINEMAKENNRRKNKHG